jgi:23S rRNA (cytidine1920-2'-O)/16S rRNA (cytidine1409-2'-O)-methyltransferase
MKTPKKRLDVALVDRGLVDSRAKAQSLIMARRIVVNERHIDKPGHAVTEDDEIRIEELEHPWVGRGGMKLAKAVEHFAINLTGRICVDIGASTGGFTDVMLAHGAPKVYAIDVGHGQLDQKLRNDPRVVNREKVNARHLEREDFADPLSFASVDVSFISLRNILPAVRRILTAPAEAVALIKPQFEVGPRDAKKGIVRDEAVRQVAVDAITQTAIELGFEVVGVIESPVKGAEGNVEFLLYLRIEN